LLELSRCPLSSRSPRRHRSRRAVALVSLFKELYRQVGTDTCRAQNLEPQCFQLTKGDGRLLLPEQDGGGMGASVVWMGDRGLFQI
jgi:hypothetical protein